MSDIVFACSALHRPSISAPTVEVAVVSTPDAIGTKRFEFGLDIFYDGKQLLTTVATTKMRNNISKSKSH